MQKSHIQVAPGVMCLLVAGATGAGCWPKGTDECSPDERRCNGNVAEHCVPPCSEIGCAWSWVKEDCGDRVCLEKSPTEVLCVISTTPDPKCAGVGGYCDGDGAVFCSDGLATERRQCPGLSADNTGVPRGTACSVLGAGLDGTPSCELVSPVCTQTTALACNAPHECSPLVAPSNRSGAAPGPLGGAIEDGTYVLEKFERFGAPETSTLLPLQITRRFEEGVLSSVTWSGGAPSTASGSFGAVGTQITWDVSCPSKDTKAFDYTATADALTLFQQVGTIVDVLSHRRL